MIQLINNNNKYEMEFLNCKMELPLSSGLHVCSSGCGSGKTTMIQQIIEKFWKNGILVAVPTIEQAKEMENYLDDLKNKLIMNGKRLKFLILHTENPDSLDIYRNTPEDLKAFDVIVVTHVRLVIDPVQLFLNFRGGGYRRFCLLDEMINFFPTPFQIPDKIKPVITFADLVKTHNGIPGTKIGTDETDRTIYQHTYRDKSIMKAALKKNKIKMFSANNELSRYKEDYILDHILHSGIDSPIMNKVKDFCSMLTVVLFDGTSDLIFPSNDPRMISVVGYRYSSDITFHSFQIELKRKTQISWNEEMVSKYCGGLIQLVKGLKGKTLIVTWKTLDSFPTNKGEASDFERLTIKYEFPDLLKQAIMNAGIDPLSVDVIHRGSGLDRGSNKYREYENLIFYGEWFLPDNITSDIGKMFGCKVKFESYMKSLLIQTICRLQIRQHTGKPISVYYSSDMSLEMMWSVQEYFRTNSKPNCKIIGVSEPFHPLTKPMKKLLFEVTLLYSIDPDLKNAMEEGLQGYKTNISLDNLFKLIKRDRKEKNKYNNIVKFLADKGITLNIV